MNKIIKSSFYIFFPLVIGGIVSLLIKDHIDYEMLTKPFLAPPNWLFPVAWSLIYLLMGISYYLYKKKYEDYSVVDTIYYGQLFVNALWSIIFFLWKLRFLAIIWILLLLGLIIILLIMFNKLKKTSYYLNIPYLFWVIFASYLTIGIYVLNG